MKKVEDKTYNVEVKEELVEHKWHKKDYAPLLAGFLKAAIREKDGKYIVEIKILKVASFIYEVLKKVCEITAGIRLQIIKHGEKKHYVINITSIYPLINDKVNLSDNQKEYLDSEGIRAYLAGCFLAAGNVTNPTAGEYMLSLNLVDEKLANTIAKKVASYDDNRHMDFKVLYRRSHYLIYLKKSDQISNFLILIGATDSMLAYENVRAERDYQNNINRIILCDQANMERSKKAGEKSLQDIELIERRMNIAYLDERTIFLMKLRKEYPMDSYSRLSDIANDMGIRMSKSTIVKGYKKIAELADKFRN